MQGISATSIFFRILMVHPHHSQFLTMRDYIAQLCIGFSLLISWWLLSLFVAYLSIYVFTVVIVIILYIYLFVYLFLLLLLLLLFVVVFDLWYFHLLFYYYYCYYCISITIFLSSSSLLLSSPYFFIIPVYVYVGDVLCFEICIKKYVDVYWTDRL